MKEHKERSKGEELLTQVLEECLEEDLSFVPPEGEIARTHRFSQEFEETMRKLLEELSKAYQKKIQRHFSPRFGQWAACILVFCACGWLFYQVSGQIGGSRTTEEMADTAAPEEAASGEAFDAGDEGLEAAAEDAPASEEEPESALSGGAALEGRTYCDRTVYPVPEQEVPEELGGVTTRVNCPVLEEDNPILMLTIGNTGEEDIRYQSPSELQVWLEDAWYLIPVGPESEGEWLMLEAGMAVDEEINLSVYQIDHEARQYRLVTHTEQGSVGAEFTFSEMFEKTMEEQED